jgi:hypothetical protein
MQQFPVAHTARAATRSIAPPFTTPAEPSSHHHYSPYAGKGVNTDLVEVEEPVEEEEEMEAIPLSESRALSTLTLPELEAQINQVMELVRASVGGESPYHRLRRRSVVGDTTSRLEIKRVHNGGASLQAIAVGAAAPSLCAGGAVCLTVRCDAGGVVVVRCDAELCSPLRSQKTGTPIRARSAVRLLTVGGLTDFLCLHLCASLGVVRCIGSVVGCLKDTGLLPDAFIDAHLSVRPMVLSQDALVAINAPRGRGRTGPRTVFYVESRAGRRRAVLVLQPDLSLVMRTPEALRSLQKEEEEEPAPPAEKEDPKWTRVFPPPALMMMGAAYAAARDDDADEKEEAALQEDPAEYLEHLFEPPPPDDDSAVVGTPMWHPDTLDAIRAILSGVVGAR